MNLEPYVENLTRQLAVAAEAGGDEAGRSPSASSRRWSRPSASPCRTRWRRRPRRSPRARPGLGRAAPARTRPRVRGDAAAGRPVGRRRAAPPATGRRPSQRATRAAMSRINLRLPDHLKARIEEAAGREGLSVNAWLVRAAAAALERGDPARADRERRRRARAASTTPAGLASPSPELASQKERTPCLLSTPPNRSPSRVELGVGDVRIVAERPRRHRRRGAPERPDQEGRRERRRADPRRVRRRPAARSRRPRAGGARSSARRPSRSTCRSSCRPARALRRRDRGGGAALPGPPRRVPLQDRRRRHPARPGRRGAAPDRRRRRHRRARPTATPRSPPAPAPCGSAAIDGAAVVKNSNGDTLDRRGHRRPAGERGQRRRSSVDRAPASGRREDRQRRRPPRRGRAAARSSLETAIRRGRDRDPRRHRRLAGPQHRASAACTTTWTPPTRPGPGETRRGPRPHLLRRHHHPPLLPPTTPRKDETMTTPRRTAIAATGLRKSFGDKVVLDGIDLRGRRGHDLRAARPQRRRQDHHGADPVHPDRRRRRARSRVAGHDLAQRAGRGARGRSASPASSPRWTSCSPARRTCILDGRPAPPGPGRGPAARRPSCSTGSTWSRRPGSRPATYSGGMRRRLDLAMTLVGDPRIIFLDEPTTGLDPRSRRTMWQIIRDLVADGVTIFLTTQYLEEADELADRVARPGPRPADRRGHARRAQAPHPRRPHPPAVRRPGRTRVRGPRPGRRRPATTTRSPCRSRATAASGRCAACSTSSTGRRSRSTASPSTRPTSTTSSSPSPANPTRKGQPLP